MSTVEHVRVMEGALLPEGPALMAALVERCGLVERISPGDRVVIKVDFMRGVDPADRTPMVDPALLGVLAESLVERGAAVAVLELSNGWERVLDGRSVSHVAEVFGFEGPYTLTDDRAAWEEADLRIVFAKLASDPDHGFVACVASMGPLRMAHFGFLDAYKDVADGVAGVLGCGWPATPLRLYGGPPDMVDAAVAGDLGLSPRCVSVEGVDRPIPDWRGSRRSRRSRALASLAGATMRHLPPSMWVPRADPGHFPRRDSAPATQRVLRRVFHRVLGLAPG